MTCWTVMRCSSIPAPPRCSRSTPWARSCGDTSTTTGLARVVTLIMPLVQGVTAERLRRSTSRRFCIGIRRKPAWWPPATSIPDMGSPWSFDPSIASDASAKAPASRRQRAASTPLWVVARGDAQWAAPSATGASVHVGVLTRPRRGQVLGVLRPGGRLGVCAPTSGVLHPMPWSSTMCSKAIHPRTPTHPPVQDELLIGKTITGGTTRGRVRSLGWSDRRFGEVQAVLRREVIARGARGAARRLRRTMPPPVIAAVTSTCRSAGQVIDLTGLATRIPGCRTRLGPRRWRQHCESRRPHPVRRLSTSASRTGPCPPCSGLDLRRSKCDATNPASRTCGAISAWWRGDAG